MGRKQGVTHEQTLENSSEIFREVHGFATNLGVTLKKLAEDSGVNLFTIYGWRNARSGAQPAGLLKLREHYAREMAFRSANIQPQAK